MPESNRPLLSGNDIEVSEVSATYKELLKIEVDPTRTLYVGDIHVHINDTDTKPEIIIEFNGKPYLKDHLLLTTSVHFPFGRDLKLTKHKVPILIKIRRTATGSGNLLASATVTGIEMPPF